MSANTEPQPDGNGAPTGADRAANGRFGKGNGYGRRKSARPSVKVPPLLAAMRYVVAHAKGAERTEYQRHCRRWLEEAPTKFMGKLADLERVQAQAAAKHAGEVQEVPEAEPESEWMQQFEDLEAADEEVEGLVETPRPHESDGAARLRELDERFAGSGRVARASADGSGGQPAVAAGDAQGNGPARQDGPNDHFEEGPAKTPAPSSWPPPRPDRPGDWKFNGLAWVDQGGADILDLLADPRPPRPPPPDRPGDWHWNGFGWTDMDYVRELERRQRPRSY
jgi:hypothetical protein